ncbi:DUF1150 family protein [Yoonia sp. 208BN28-4]|uniref:DUF1150 family protein n=1 Tax=Yoonia sp. 208BN28-4 TaxID=3126505 RepID=UPI0030B7C38B
MDTKVKFDQIDQKIVYVKAIAATDLPDDVQDEVGDVDTVFAVHDKDGAQLALVANRKLAFHLARENNLHPVTVH